MTDNETSSGAAPGAPAEHDAHVTGVVRRRRYGLWGVTVAGILMALFVWALATRPAALDRQASSPLLGHAAPPLSGPSVTPVSFTSLDLWRGRWSVVNFFATWCVPCRREHPEFLRFMNEHQSVGDVSLVMVIYDDKPANVQDFFRTEGGSWPAVPDPQGQISLDYGVSGVPETYLIDPAGTVSAKIVGGLTADGLDRLLARAKSQGA